MAILSSTEYPAIRAAIDTELDTNSLPDAIIALSIYAGAADNDVIERDPDAESRTGDEATRILNAAIYFCAARLVPAAIRITGLNTTTRDLSYRRPLYDPEKRAEELRGLAEEEINEVLTPSETSPERPTMFTVASGVRGK